jgi:hypothetical protein
MRGQQGFSALELLIIVVVVCSMVGVGVPMLHRGADSAVLDSNLQSLGSMVTEMVNEGYSPTYRGSGEGDAQVYISSALEQTLSPAGTPVYANPFVGRSKGTAVINAHQVALQQGFVAPAVLITDASDLQYPVFSGLSLAERRAVAGSLIVAFDNGGGTIDVYFVDQKGKGSHSVVSVPTAPVRAGRHG